MKNNSIRLSIRNAFVSFGRISPIIVAIVLVSNLLSEFFSDKVLERIFTAGPIDTLYGTLLGSFFAGNALTSYIIGGELLGRGISLYAVSAFLISWVTVGVLQLPLEIKLFGRGFALKRNLLNFVFSILIAIFVVWTMRIFI